MICTAMITQYVVDENSRRQGSSVYNGMYGRGISAWSQTYACAREKACQ